MSGETIEFRKWKKFRSERHDLHTTVTARPSGVRVEQRCACGSWALEPWPQAAETVVARQAEHTGVFTEEGRAEIRQRFEKAAAQVRCKHATTVEAVGLRVCLECGVHMPKRRRRRG